VGIMKQLPTVNDIRLSELSTIPLNSGDVQHALKNTDLEFDGFGEVYFSWIKAKKIKAWKMHKKMTLNLVVPVGRVQFVFFSQNLLDPCRIEIIGESAYSRLTVPPCIWFGFSGLSRRASLVVNIANIAHDPEEVIQKEINEIPFNWRVE